MAQKLPLESRGFFASFSILDGLRQRWSHFDVLLHTEKEGKRQKQERLKHVFEESLHV